MDFVFRMLTEGAVHIFPPPVDIGENEGFDPQRDIFRRSEFGRGISNLLELSSDPLVVMLDAPWGSGKTTFIKMLAGQLRNDGFPLIHFDAFENDHVDNAFLAVASEVIRLSKKLQGDETPQHKKFLKKAARAGSVLLRTGVKVGVKAATLGAIDAADVDALKSIASDVAKETSTKADEYVENLLNLQSQERETLNGVKDALAGLAQSLGKVAASNISSDKVRPLIFIVDELDRCRPPFALELLEKIKHIFSIPNVHFLLSTHLSQLENSVRFNYGSDIDARVYLQKFYNIILHFPAAEESRGVEQTTSRYFQYLSKTMPLDDNIELIQGFAEAKQLSLRSIERILTNVAIARTFVPNNFLWLSPIICGLAIFKVVNPPLFQKAIAARISLNEVVAALDLDNWLSSSESSAKWMKDWWTFCLANDEAKFPDLDWKGFRSSLFRYSIHNRRDIVRLMAGHFYRLKLPES